jgi:hypothetical protein
MKFSFFQLGIELNFLKLVENKTSMPFMVLHVLKENEDVVNVTNHKIIPIFLKSIVF